jgi:hypothetical protein
MTRLEHIAPDIAEELRRLAPDELRAVSLLACQLALQDADQARGEAETWLNHLREEGALPALAQISLEKLIAQMDEKYFNLREQADDSPTPDSAPAQQEHLEFFRKARALSALSFAAQEDLLAGAMESIYEASAAVQSATCLFDAVRQAIRRQPPIPRFSA